MEMVKIFFLRAIFLFWSGKIDIQGWGNFRKSEMDLMKRRTKTCLLQRCTGKCRVFGTEFFTCGNFHQPTFLQMFQYLLALADQRTCLATNFLDVVSEEEMLQ